MNIFDQQFSINRQNCPLLVQSFSPDANNPVEKENRLVALLMQAESQVLGENYQMLLEWLVTLTGKSALPLPGSYHQLFHRLLDSQQKKYTLLTVADRLTCQQSKPITKWLLYLYLDRYFLMKNVNTHYDTIVSALSTGIRSCDQLVKQLREDKNEYLEFVQKQNAQLRGRVLQNLEKSELSAERTVNILQLLFKNPKDTVPEEQKHLLMRVFRQKQVDLQTAIQHEVQFNLFDTLLTENSVQYVYTPEAKLAYLCKYIVNHKDNPAKCYNLMEKLGQYLGIVELQSITFRGIPLQDVLYKALDVVGSDPQLPAEISKTLLRALDSLKISPQNNLTLWIELVNKTQVKNFAAFCIGRLKQHIPKVVPLGEKWTNRCWKFMDDTVSKYSEITNDSGNILGEIITAVMVLANVSKKPIPSGIKEKLKSVHTAIQTNSELSNEANLSIVQYRLQQLLSDS